MGSTTLRADYPGIPETTATVNVGAPPAINVSAGIIGDNTDTSLGLSLAAAPPSNETMTITSADPTHFLLSQHDEGRKRFGHG